MFQPQIGSTALTSRGSDRVFTNVIAASNYREDVSFLATLRMMLHDRIKEGERVTLSVRRSTRSANGYHETDVVYDIIRGLGVTPTGMNAGDFCIVYLDGMMDEDRTRIMDFYDTKFTEYFPGWERMQKVTDFFRSAFRVSCFYSTDNKNVILLCDRMNFRIYHSLQSGVFGYFPWYFFGRDSLTDEKMELLKSFREQEPAKYLSCIDKFAEQFDFRSEMIRSGLAGFENNRLKEMLADLESQMDDFTEKIRYHRNEICNYVSRKEDVGIRYLGIQQKIADGTQESELMEYFLINKRLVLEEVSGNAIYFGVKDYLEFWDPEQAEPIIGNRTGYIYDTGSGRISPDDMEKLMREIFLKRKIRVKVCAVYKIDTTGYYEGYRGWSFSHDYDGFLPNPHIQDYGCTGDYERYVGEFMEKHDYIGAIDQYIVSAKSLAFSDSTVMRAFMRQLYNNTHNFLELPDGTCVDPVGAVKWIQAQEGKEGV